METIEYLKFYAVGNIDSKTGNDKLFTWKINSIIDLPARLKYFASKYEIKAAWYVCRENGKVVANQKIDMNLWYSDSDHPVTLSDEI